MKNPDSKVGTYGWCTLVAGVVAWDIIAPETLSSAFDRYLEHPVGKYVAIGATAIVGAHVLNLFEAYDIPDPIISANDYLLTLKERLGTNG